HRGDPPAQPARSYRQRSQARTLPAESLRQQLIDAFGEVRSPAVANADKLRQSWCFPALRSVLDKRPEQLQGTQRLLLTKVGDELLQLLLRGHLSSVDTMIKPSVTTSDRVDSTEGWEQHRVPSLT